MKKKSKKLANVLLMPLTGLAAPCEGSGKGDGSELDPIVVGSFGVPEAAPRFATYHNEDLDGVTLSDDVSWHNGAIYYKPGDYMIKNSNIIMNSDADGQDTNDFSGLGAAVMAVGKGVNLTIEDSKIETSGVLKVAVTTDEAALTVVKNSTVIAKGGTIYDGYISTADKSIMAGPPWVLGLGGSSSEVNARSTDITGWYAVGVYIDSDIQSAGWGAASSDNGSEMTMTVVNCDISVGQTGYGAYAVDECVEEYYGSRIDATTYGVIMTGAKVTFMSYNEGQKIPVFQFDGDYDKYGIATGGKKIYTAVSEKAKGIVKSQIKSDGFGFMFHSNRVFGANVVELFDGTSVTCPDAVFLLKKMGGEIVVDNAVLESTEKKVILQIIDNDDDYVGLDDSNYWGHDDGYGHTLGWHETTFNDTFHEEPGYSNEWIAPTSASYLRPSHKYQPFGNWVLDYKMTNTKVDGDFWNSSGYVGRNPATTLNVSLGRGAVVNGVISAGAFSHDTKDAKVGNGNWSEAKILGHVTNIPYFNDVNLVKVALSGNAVWNLTGDCIIDTLTIEGSASVSIPEGATLKVRDTVYEAGTLTADTYIS